MARKHCHTSCRIRINYKHYYYSYQPCNLDTKIQQGDKSQQDTFGLHQAKRANVFKIRTWNMRRLKWNSKIGEVKKEMNSTDSLGLCDNHRLRQLRNDLQ